MSQQELLKKVIQAFERAGIEYMLTGSLVSSMQGEPRSTHDFDFVAALDINNAGKLIDSLSDPQIFLDPDMALEAISSKTMFNLIDLNSSDKVDIWLLTNEPFDLSRFDRKYTVEVLGVKVYVTRPEDTILMKLKWAKLSGGSEKQFTDALRVYEVQFNILDQEYLDNWADQLDIAGMLAQIRDQAEVI